MHLLRFGNKLNEEVCDGFIFANLFNSLYLLVRLWWNILVTNLATYFQDLVSKVKKLVALAPVLGPISRPVHACYIQFRPITHHRQKSCEVDFFWHLAESSWIVHPHCYPNVFCNPECLSQVQIKEKQVKFDFKTLQTLFQSYNSLNQGATGNPVVWLSRWE